jgi:hypothetical protein
MQAEFSSVAVEQFCPNLEVLESRPLWPLPLFHDDGKSPLQRVLHSGRSSSPVTRNVASQPASRGAAGDKPVRAFEVRPRTGLLRSFARPRSGGLPLGSCPSGSARILFPPLCPLSFLPGFSIRAPLGKLASEAKHRLRLGVMSMTVTGGVRR